MTEIKGTETLMGDTPATGKHPLRDGSRECWHGEEWRAGPSWLQPVYVYGCCKSDSILVSPWQREEKTHGGAAVIDALQGAENIARALRFLRPREVPKPKTTAIAAPPGGIHT